MENLLYYPYINIPRTDWTIRTLLYYDHVASIVPQNYFYEPERYDEFMRELVQNELVIPIDPMQVLERPWEVSHQFIEYVNSDEFRQRIRRKKFLKERFGRIHTEKFQFNRTRIHSQKFDNDIFYQLEQSGLAEREDYEWFKVEQNTANELMSFLASVVGGKMDFLPATDIQVRNLPFTGNSEKVYRTIRKEQVRREIILRELIPFPEQIDLGQLRRFKDRYPDLLNRFRNQIELIALNHTIDEESQLFEETLRELKFQKEEISARMTESQFGPIFFGTVCGITGAIIGLAAAGASGAIVGSLSALPSFANAVNSALRIERIENIANQSGMKYLALVDRRLRRQVVNVR